MAKVLVEYIWDDEAQAWGFAVPALHIVGGGPTHADARRRAVEAITVALESADVEPAADTEYLDVRVG